MADNYGRFSRRQRKRLQSMPPPIEALVSGTYATINKWRFRHSVIFGIIFVLSATAFVSLAFVNKYFAPNCILNATWVLQKGPACGQTQDRCCQKEHQSKCVTIDKDSLWGYEDNCSFTQYGTGALSSMAFILGWFFVLFNPTRSDLFERRPTAASLLVMPAMIVTFVGFLTQFASSTMLQDGFTKFCSRITDDDVQRHVRLDWCYQIDAYQIIGYDNSKHFIRLLITAQLLEWLSAVLWGAQFCLLAYRFWLHIDFPDSIYGSLQPPKTSDSVDGLVIKGKYPSSEIILPCSNTDGSLTSSLSEQKSPGLYTEPVRSARGNGEIPPSSLPLKLDFEDSGSEGKEKLRLASDSGKDYGTTPPVHM